jgi:cytoskeletal protein CcmA (bactofilin family)
MIAPSDDTVEGTDASTQISVVTLVESKAASSLPFGVVATLGRSTISNDLTIIGQGVRIVSKARLQIDGNIFGDIIGSDLTIGSEGSVTGLVSAERINVFGRVIGEIRAMTVILHPTSQVRADLLHQTLEIAEGAQFDGCVRRCRDIADLKPNFDVA